MTRTITFVICSALIGLTQHVAAQDAPPSQPPAQAKPQPAPQERVAAIKQSFAQSQAKLRSLEWIETTVLTLKGEEKSSKDERCYYDLDGKLTKEFVDKSAPPKEKGGLRGKVIAKKKTEMSEYMDAASELVHQYLPPDPEKIQACKEAGKASIEMLDPGKRARIVLRDYLVPGDSLSFDIDPSDNRILALAVSTFLGDQKDAVTLNVTFAALPDGTIHTAKTVLDAKAKEIKVTIENAGYRPAEP